MLVNKCAYKLKTNKKAEKKNIFHLIIESL